MTKTPRAGDLSRQWPHLTPEQRLLVIDLVALLARPMPDLIEMELLLSALKVSLLRTVLDGGKR